MKAQNLHSIFSNTNIENEDLRIEIVRMLYSSSSRSFIASVLIAITLVFTEREVVSSHLLWVWTSVFILFYGIRFILSLSYYRQVDRDQYSARWLTRFRLSTAACGIAWGLGGLLFSQQLGDSTLEGFAIIVLMGVLSAAIMSYSIDVITANLFAIGVLALTLPNLFISATVFSISLAIMLIIFMLYVSVAGQSVAKKVRENIVMRITANKQEEEIKALAERQKLHVDLTPMGVIEWDSELNVVSWNKSAESILGYSAEEAMSMPMDTIIPLEKRKRTKDLMLQLLNDGVAQSFHDDSLRQDGKIIYCEWIYTVLKDKNNQIVGLASLVQDKSAFKKNQDEINFLAYYDLLTNLPNRRLLIDKLEHTIVTTKRSKLYGCALLIDLDNFKDLNDLHGHDVGDLLLQEVARRLKVVTREEDIVSRFAGDEFIVILDKLGQMEDSAMSAASIVVEKIIAEMSRVYLLGEYEHRTSSSIGICLFKGDELSASEVIKRADIAMFQAKKAG